VIWLLRFVSAGAGTLNIKAPLSHCEAAPSRATTSPSHGGVRGCCRQVIAAREALTRPIKTSVALTSTTTGVARATTSFREGTDE
jgi:hypothetical protein